MKSLLINSVIGCVLSLMVVSSGFAWKCQMHNAKGQIWNGTGPTRAAAAANAMKFCSRNSTYAANCVVDWCR